MKKRLSIVLVLVMLLSLSVPAFAEEARYQNTRAVLKDLDGYDNVQYELAGVINFDRENYELVKISYKSSSSEYVSNFSLLFNEDESDVVLYMNPLIKFDESKMEQVLGAVNSINAQTTGVKLYVDTSDNSVSAELFLLVTKDSVVELTETGMGFMAAFTDKVYEQLSQFAA